jgi:hypothetical protein
MYEQELETIIETLREMESHFEPPTTAAAPHLSSSDRSAFKRLMLEAKGILDAELGLNDFGAPLVKMTSLPGYGAFNPPSLEELHEAIVLVEGGLNSARRKRSQAPNLNGVVARPSYVAPARIMQLRGISSQQWDLRRLVRLPEAVKPVVA